MFQHPFWSLQMGKNAIWSQFSARRLSKPHARDHWRLAWYRSHLWWFSDHRPRRHNRASCVRPRPECNPVLGSPSEGPEAKSQQVTVSITRGFIYWSRAHTRGPNSQPREDQGDPRNAYPSLQRFLGMVTYLSKFVLNLSDHTELLRTLTVKPEVPIGGGCPNMKSPDSSSSLCKLLPQFYATMVLTYQLLFSVTRRIMN